LVLFFARIPSPQAQWVENGVLLCTDTLAQDPPRITTDGGGGAIVVWEDYRIPYESHIYAQRIDTDGHVLWGEGGIRLTTVIDSQDDPRAVADGYGGAVVTWEENRSGVSKDLFAQRIDTDGNLLWTPDGKAVCTVAGHKWDPRLVSHGGGAIITWYNVDLDIYAQRVDADGDIQWAVGGVALCTASGRQDGPQIISDGAGGAIVAWYDDRDPVDGIGGIYAQRIDADGNTLWASNGSPVCTDAMHYLYDPRVIPDGAGGAIVAWWGSGFTIEAQRIDADGNPLWTEDRVLVCSAPCVRWHPDIASDGAGGAYVVWEDYREAPNCDPEYVWAHVFAQRIDAGGNIQWTTNGVNICPSWFAQWQPHVVADGGGGAIVSWEDQRYSYLNEKDVYAQRLNAEGDFAWTPDGIAICTVDASHSGPARMVSDGAWGAILTWADKRAGNTNVFAMRVGPNGTMPPTHAGDAGVRRNHLMQNVPNPFNPTTTIRYQLAEQGYTTLKIYDVNGALVRVLESRHLEPGRHEAVWDGENKHGGRVSSGVYFYKLTTVGFAETRKMIILK
jgi:hypothetical protein